MRGVIDRRGEILPAGLAWAEPSQGTGDALVEPLAGRVKSAAEGSLLFSFGKPVAPSRARRDREERAGCARRTSYRSRNHQCSIAPSSGTLAEHQVVIGPRRSPPRSDRQHGKAFHTESFYRASVITTTVRLFPVRRHVVQLVHARDFGDAGVLVVVCGLYGSGRHDSVVSQRKWSSGHE